MAISTTIHQTIGMRLSIFISVLFCSVQADAGGFLPNSAFTDKARGTTVGTFLKINPSVRGGALADTLSVSSVDPASGFFMPANFIGTEGKPYLSVMSGMLPEDMVQAGVLYGGNAGRGKWAAGAHQLQQPSIDLYDIYGTRTGSFSPWDAAFVGGYANRYRQIPWGAQLSLIQSKISPNASGTGFAVGFGAALPFGYFSDRNLSFAVALNNFGPPMTIHGKSYPLPGRAQTSVGYRLGPSINMNMDLFLPVDQGPYFASGLEWKMGFAGAEDDSAEIPSDDDIDGYFSKSALSNEPRYGMSFFTGLTTKNKTDSITDKLSFGLRLYLSSLYMDAGVSSFGNLGYAPRFSLTYQF